MATGIREACVMAMVLVAAAGCGRGAGIVPVSGRVEVDGKPLSTGGIMVVPETGRAASGSIAPDGRFTLSTFKEGDGVVKGRHKVEIFAVTFPTKTTKRWLVPTHARTAATSKVWLDVTGPTADALVSISTDGEELADEPYLGE